jgi:ADP-ribose diphosphatase
LSRSDDVSRSAKPRRDPIADGSAEAVILDRELLAKAFHPYDRFRFRLATSDTPQTRDILRSGSVAAVLPIDLKRDEIVLLQQFRLPAHLANGKGDLIEIVAGYVEANERPIEAARRECIEEIGVAPSVLVELFTYFTSPGMSDEQITVFLGLVDASRVPQRAGAAAEHEDIVLMRVAIDSALEALAAGTVHNGPLIVALQWLALNRGRLAEIARSTSASA